MSKPFVAESVVEMATTEGLPLLMHQGDGTITVTIRSRAKAKSPMVMYQ